jgi:hypothetical protein
LLFLPTADPLSKLPAWPEPSIPGLSSGPGACGFSREFSWTYAFLSSLSADQSLGY